MNSLTRLIWSYGLFLFLLRAFFIEELEQSREFFSNQNRLLRLLVAVYNLLSANSELLCYFIIVLNNVVSASVISLVLPILVFLWAMLSAPRPTKRFWMTAIVYTEVCTHLQRPKTSIISYLLLAQAGTEGFHRRSLIKAFSKIGGLICWVLCLDNISSK